MCVEEDEVILNRSSSQPRFMLGKLEARRSYTINIYSFNTKVQYMRSYTINIYSFNTKVQYRRSYTINIYPFNTKVQ